MMNAIFSDQRLTGNAVFSSQVYVSGVVDGVASGAVLAGTGSLSAGSASGTSDGIAPGAVLEGASTLIPGSASAISEGTAPGAVLDGAGTFIPGSAEGQVSATAPGAGLTGSGTMIPGAASNTTIVFTRAPSGAGPRINTPIYKRPANIQTQSRH